MHGTGAPAEMSLEPEIISEGVSPDSVKTPQEIIARDAEAATMANMTFLRFKQASRRPGPPKGNGVDEELVVADDQHRDRPGGVLSKIAEMAVELQKEQKTQQQQNEDSAEEKTRMKKLEKMDSKGLRSWLQNLPV